MSCESKNAESLLRFFISVFTDVVVRYKVSEAVRRRSCTIPFASMPYWPLQKAAKSMADRNHSAVEDD